MPWECAELGSQHQEFSICRHLLVWRAGQRRGCDPGSCGAQGVLFGKKDGEFHHLDVLDWREGIEENPKIPGHGSTLECQKCCREHGPVKLHLSSRITGKLSDLLDKIQEGQAGRT